MPEEKAPKKHIRPVIEEIVNDTPVSSSTVVETTPQAPTVPQSPVSQTPVPQPATTPLGDHSKKSFHISLGFMVVVIVVAIIVALVTGALYVYFNGVNGLKTNSLEASPVATLAPAATPSASPASSSLASPAVGVKLDQYKVSVLNGSGKPGEAGKAKDLLEKAGFKVTSTGNAANFSFKNTQIQAKSTVATDVVNKAEDALSGLYETAIGTTLDSKASFDIIVTVGAE